MDSANIIDVVAYIPYLSFSYFQNPLLTFLNRKAIDFATLGFRRLHSKSKCA